MAPQLVLQLQSLGNIYNLVSGMGQFIGSFRGERPADEWGRKASCPRGR